MYKKLVRQSKLEQNNWKVSADATTQTIIKQNFTIYNFKTKNKKQKRYRNKAKKKLQEIKIKIIKKNQ